jgi:hypothetical protein
MFATLSIFFAGQHTYHSHVFFVKSLLIRPESFIMALLFQTAIFPVPQHKKQVIKKQENNGQEII